MTQPGERTVVLEGPPPPRGSSVLTTALRIVDAGPRYFAAAAVISLAGTSVLTIVLAQVVRPAARLPRPQRDLIELGLVGLILTAVVVVVAAVSPAARRSAVLDRVVAPEQRAAIWLALAVWFPLLLIPVYYRAESTLRTSVVWIAFGFLDKRWVTATYLLGALAPVVFLVTAARVLTAGRAQPASWRAWFRGLAPAPDEPRHRDGGQQDPKSAPPAGPSQAWWTGRAVRATVGTLTAAGVAYYFYGPPWYLGRSGTSGPIGAQEDVFLTGMQAISKGGMPYIGPASVQYGPGAQLLSYFYMRHIAGFSVLGFRESWAMLQWAGATIFFVVLFLALGYGRGLAAALLSALVYPALQLMGFTSAHSYTGFWGWANPLRYVGAMALILLLPAIIRRSPSWRGLTGAAAVGLVWGALSYVAQENLIAGAVGALVVAALLLLSGTSSWRSVWTALLAALGGFIVSWLPAVVYYAMHGLLARFLYLYFLITRAVAGGYSNTPYGGFSPTKGQIFTSAPWRTIFYDLPWVLAVLALLAVIEVRPFRIAVNWSAQRITLVAVVLTTILLYQGGLLRSDAFHLTGTLLILPALVVTVASLLPRLLGGRRRATLVVAGAAIAVASFALLPSRIYLPSAIRAEAVAPYQVRQRLAAEPAKGALSSLAARRVGPGVLASLDCCQRDPELMGTFLPLANRIHALVGDRITYVASFPGGYPGAIYFVADLRPAPIPIDLYTMVFTAQQRVAYMAAFRRSVLPHVQALITATIADPEAQYFLQRYPRATKITLTYSGEPYYVLLGS
ncbi:MAG TPA: hypothetical protein VLM11_23090 [Streptosporangiaceae bacterium]|nr:hypothetical protein [Streptosporangiaceae bacterium]